MGAVIRFRVSLLALLATSVCLWAAAGARASTVTVSTTMDSGAGSLRDAIATVPAGSTIIVPSGNYVLSSGELVIAKDLTIQGAGARSTTVSGSGCPAATRCRVFRIQSGVVSISGLTVTGGKAIGPGGGGPSPNGGGIFNQFATLTLTEVSVSGNTATGMGGTGGFGGGIENLGTLTLQRSTVSGNLADCQGASCGGDGGGVILENGSLTVENSTISGNTAGDPTGDSGLGGGIAIGQASASFANSTIAANTANGPARTDGRGGNVFGFARGTFTFKNSIVANGIATNGENCVFFPANGGSITSLGHNLDSLDQCNFHAAGDKVGANPLLGPLANNGGQTDTQALLSGSPAIDAASADCPSPATDQRGISRPQGPACDIGAFELVKPPPPPPPVPPVAPVKAPKISVRGVGGAGCRSANFRAHVSISDALKLSGVDVLLDGKRIAHAQNKHVGVRVLAKKLASGLHAIKIVATNSAGKRSVRIVHFTRCGRTAPRAPHPPRFTG